MSELKCASKDCQLCYPPAKESGMKDVLLKLADQYEDEASEAYTCEKWQEAAILYRLACDLRLKAAEAEDEKPKSLKNRGTQGELYEVTTESCTCMDFKFRGGPCKHMTSFKEGYYDKDGALAYHVVNR
jgi:hypothetical protein